MNPSYILYDKDRKDLRQNHTTVNKLLHLISKNVYYYIIYIKQFTKIIIKRIYFDTSLLSKEICSHLTGP